MNKKSFALVVLAMLLVCVLSIAGTVAYLEARTAVVTNTFIAAGVDGPFVDTDETTGKKMFELLEYKANAATNGSGSYTLDTYSEVDGNDYEVMPGMTIPKQPFVKLSRTYSKTVTKTDAEGKISSKTYGPAPAYLFVEVWADAHLKGENSVYTWAVDDAWTKLANVTGPNGGDVYVYGANGGIVLTTVPTNTKYDILKDDKITVNEKATAEQIGKEAIEMKFYAYLAQASVGESDAPADVFTACFTTPAETETPGEGE